MKKKHFLNGLLAFQFLLLSAYTVAAFNNEGASLFNIFLFNVQSFNWNGQFNLDFSCYLILSGLWIMWRKKFSLSSMASGVAAIVIGIIFFAPYLMYLIAQEKGNLRNVLIGER